MIDLNELSPTDFEELRYNLLLKLGLKNINWRKGKTSSPSDLFYFILKIITKGYIIHNDNSQF